jgi:hypothetical protein
MVSNTRRNVIIVSIIALIGIFHLLTLREGHCWGGDFSMYIQHAKNIVEGTEYRNTGYLYNYRYSTLGPETFPPVFPLLLTPVYYWFGLHFIAMKVELVLLFLIALWFIYTSFKSELPFPYLAAIVGILGFNPYFWSFKDNILADIPFLFFIYLSLWFIHRAHQSTLSKRFQLFSAVISGFMIYLAYGTRSLGLLLIFCLVIYDFIRLRKIERFTIVTIIVFGLFMMVQAILSHNDSGYLDQLTHITLYTIVQNTEIYARQLSLFWDNGFYHSVRHLLFGVTCILAIIGYLTRIRRSITVFEIFLFLYLAAIIIFPFTQMRYLIPVFPLYIFYTFVGIHEIARFYRITQERYIFTILLLGIVFSYLAKYTTFDYGPIHEGIHTKEAIELFTSIKHNTTEQDVIIFQKPRVLALFTERKVAAYHPTNDDQELWNYFQQIQATYLITGPFDSEYFLHFVRKYQERFILVDSISDFKIYKIQTGLWTKLLLSSFLIC